MCVYSIYVLNFYLAAIILFASSSYSGGGGGLVAKSCLTLCDPPWTVACQAPLSMCFSRQEHWSGLPCPSPGDLPDSGTEPTAPALAS